MIITNAMGKTDFLHPLETVKMTKSKFFAMLDSHLDSHNSTFDAFGNRVPRQDRQYSAADIEAHHHSETPEEVARLKEVDPAYPWDFHASGWCLAGCWYITAISHKTEEAAKKQAAIFSRWIKEYKNKK